MLISDDDTEILVWISDLNIMLDSFSCIRKETIAFIQQESKGFHMPHIGWLLKKKKQEKDDNYLH